MQHEHARGDVAFGQSRNHLSRGVEAFEHTKLADFRRIKLRGGVEIDQPLFETLQNPHAHYRLRAGKQRQNAVKRHRRPADEAFARRALVEVRGPVRDACDDGGEAGRRTGRLRGGGWARTPQPISMSLPTLRVRLKNSLSGDKTTLSTPRRLWTSRFPLGAFSVRHRETPFQAKKD